MAFWTEPQMASIDKMLNPRSIAIVGATGGCSMAGGFWLPHSRPKTGCGFMPSTRVMTKSWG